MINNKKKLINKYIITKTNVLKLKIKYINILVYI